MEGYGKGKMGGRKGEGGGRGKGREGRQEENGLRWRGRERGEWEWTRLSSGGNRRPCCLVRVLHLFIVERSWFIFSIILTAHFDCLLLNCASASKSVCATWCLDI